MPVLTPAKASIFSGLAALIGLPVGLAAVGRGDDRRIVLRPAHSRGERSATANATAAM